MKYKVGDVLEYYGNDCKYVVARVGNTKYYIKVLEKAHLDLEVDLSISFVESNFKLIGFRGQKVGW